MAGPDPTEAHDPGRTNKPAPAEAVRGVSAQAHTKAVNEAWARGFLECLARSIKPGDVICDCGANIGFVTEILLGTGAIIHAFEPDPHAVEILRRKFAAHENVIIHPVAVGAAAGTVQFFRNVRFLNDPDHSGQGNSTVLTNRQKELQTWESCDVDVIDFPAFLLDLEQQGQMPVFVKMDIEGSEFEVIPGMLELGLFDRIDLTVIETHPQKFPERKAEVREMLNRVSTLYPKSRVNLEWI